MLNKAFTKVARTNSTEELNWDWKFHVCTSLYGRREDEGASGFIGACTGLVARLGVQSTLYTLVPAQ